ncbi:energy transducer TonB [Hyalangium rubrum]|uniref:TonB family protein n=1 Tax=Hyalangium rubrum TaxID=3103134 RepID=A0ABU5GZ28_9BACT|nr:TonB family protein [Hyalangium sp. s54d21]MDY7226461.1 TonB family protein [Hyalangium sp. s54d21]
MALHGFLALLLQGDGSARMSESRVARGAPSDVAPIIWFEGAGDVPGAGQVASASRPVGAAAPVEAVPERPPERVPRSVNRPRKVVVIPFPKKAPGVARPEETGAVSDSATGEIPSLDSEPGASGGDFSGEEGASQGASEDAVDTRAWAVSAAALAGVSGLNMGTQGSTSAPRGAGASSGELRAYSRRLFSGVTRQRRYPASAVRLGMQGTARIQFRVNRDGSLAGAPMLARSSGHSVLDTEALRMVEAAAPFEPLPVGHPSPTAEFVIPVDFALNPSR